MTPAAVPSGCLSVFLYGGTGVALLFLSLWLRNGERARAGWSCIPFKVPRPLFQPFLWNLFPNPNLPGFGNNKIMRFLPPSRSLFHVPCVFVSECSSFFEKLLF